jgi:hypothetical protein
MLARAGSPMLSHDASACAPPAALPPAGSALGAVEGTVRAVSGDADLSVLGTAGRSG